MKTLFYSFHHFFGSFNLSLYAINQNAKMAGKRKHHSEARHAPAPHHSNLPIYPKSQVAREGQEGDLHLDCGQIGLVEITSRMP
jgi:hypothetical protein